MLGLDREHLAGWRDRLEDTLRHADLRQQPVLTRWSIGTLRLVTALLRDLARGELNLFAMSLVYTTLLSLVPLLAISFSVLKGFGVHNQIEPLLLNLLEPLGEKGVEVAGLVIQFVDNMKVGVLGSLGFALLFYTVVSLMQKIERAFNAIWRIDRARSFGERVRDYLLVVILGPAVIFSAAGITATVASAPLVADLANIESLSAAAEFLGRLIPFFMIVGAFTFMYAYIPNTRVQLRAAFTGALVAGVLWHGAAWAFGAVVVGSGKYTAIYATFASLILVLIWMYVSWLILMIGTSIAFYLQNPSYLRGEQGPQRLSQDAREKVALAIISLITRDFYRGAPGWSVERLANHLGTRMEPVSEVLDVLEDRGLLKRTMDTPETYLPARPFEEARVVDVLLALRRGMTSDAAQAARLATTAEIEAIVRSAEEAIEGRIGGRSLKDLGLHAGTGPPVETLPGRRVQG